MSSVGRVAELWRHPVKSMGGEQLAEVRVDGRGIHADRLWATYDLELGATTTARRLPDLLRCSARFATEPPTDAGPGEAVEVIVTLPGGEERSSSDPVLHERLSELVGRRVELRPLPPTSDPAAYRGARLDPQDLRRQLTLEPGEPLPDLSMFPLRKLAELARYATPVGTFADAYPLHLLTTSSMSRLASLAPDADVDVRRFRPSILVDTGTDPELAELDWLQAWVDVGDVRASPKLPTIRCSMPTREQPGMDASPAVIRTISRELDRCFGVYADVERGGTVRVGDPVVLQPVEPPSPLRRAARGVVRRGVRTWVAAVNAMPRR